ncbi:MAG: 30S ribosomal protein S27e [Candidatus Woesearchaeota archaeon]|jgi:small subunit ribosomal protein S27e|nr:30S ribosomal protein S27e [Candidatus Woesearchaeota archaeon]MDP7181830.1 30S ribosomal protein S27e [Candidatus Woesearchaeota archaeon]MDP7199006.1 30S ribosomal protein S27e [Candidatus Woesearchaeota archaeon]MDP7467740.1 30S ribosomal protein S27e [Candidatus Woesearchaeota archaeon]MDP7646824.1 30S ribosomal protein S27e [Candidatus Woesearchaeota archaeon]
MKETSNKFVKVRCEKCKNEQILFERASTEVSCLVCNEALATPTGGKTEIKGRVLEMLE